MSRKAHVKVCGITNLADAELAVELGAGFLGFNFYKKSPRSLTLETYRSLGRDLPDVKRVYVQVRPEPDELRKMAEEGFDFFQLHFLAEENPRTIEKWAEIVSPEKVWLAPKIAPNEDLPRHLLASAESFLIDTYHPDSFGGTGRTGDWQRFREWSKSMPEKRWVLAGGLSPENIRTALEQSGASVVDVNSGIEERPGKKDHARMREFFATL